jgi:excisionase family DNA binding protein
MTAAERLQPYTDELTLEQACDYLGIKPQTMYNRIKQGMAPARFKENGRWKFKRSDLEQYRQKMREGFKAFQ